jgi:peptidoglycan/LPS O-acetylase OafA/YrhL
VDTIVARGDPAAPGTAEAIGSASYRPQLDGLRAVAVYLVVAFHVGLARFSGGFVGVDVFFVLSGYLVTRILLRDLVAGGRVRAREFYARRVRRILPASLVALVVTAVAYTVVASPAEVLDVVGGFRASFVYIANWYFVQQSTDYFAPSATASPVLHFWSLAVEEQFYLLWPLVLSVVFVATRAAGRWRWWALRLVVGAMALGSAVAAVRIGTTNLDRAYYGTDTRAYQVLAGALIALTPQVLRFGPRLRRVARWSASAGLVALIVLASSALDLGPITRGVWVTLVAMVVVVALENTQGGTAQRLLSTRPFTYLGRISYGTYLWHWPLVVLLAFGSPRSPIELLLIVAPAATALAALSFHVLEHPIRASAWLDRYKAPSIAIGFAVSILLGIVVVPGMLDRSVGSTTVSPGPGPKTGTKLLDWREARADTVTPPDCLRRPIDGCIVARGTGARVLLLGDSHARMWMPSMLEIAKREGWTLDVAVQVSCSWQLGIQWMRRSPFVPVCRQQQADWYTRVVPAFAPDIVVLAEQAKDDPALDLPFVAPNGRSLTPGDPVLERALTRSAKRSLAQLRRPGRRIVILEPVPQTDAFDPLDCLSDHEPDCTYPATRQPTPLERYFREEARVHGDTTSVDVDRLVCPRWPVCDPVVGNIIVRRDNSHLTATYARSIAPALEEAMFRAGS